MRTFAYFNIKFDKKYIILVLLAVIIGIIFGIVLYKNIINNIYLKKFSSEYLYYVFNFKTSTLILRYFFSELLFCYLFLSLAYFLKLKYITLIFVFIKGIFISVYTISLFSINAFNGALVIIFIFIPSSIISVTANVVSAEISLNFDKFKALIFPFLLCLISGLIYFLLLNVIFRFMVVIA